MTQSTWEATAHIRKTYSLCVVHCSYVGKEDSPKIQRQHHHINKSVFIEMRGLHKTVLEPWRLEWVLNSYFFKTCSKEKHIDYPVPSSCSLPFPSLLHLPFFPPFYLPMPLMFSGDLIYFPLLGVTGWVDYLSSGYLHPK